MLLFNWLIDVSVSPVKSALGTNLDHAATFFSIKIFVILAILATLVGIGNKHHSTDIQSKMKSRKMIEEA